MPVIKNIFIYPIKNFNGIEVEESHVLPSGRLARDKEFALFDNEHNLIDSARYPLFEKINVVYNYEKMTVEFQTEGRSEVFSLEKDFVGIEKWFGNILGIDVKLERNSLNGFADETSAPGPRIVNQESLLEVSKWFQKIAPDDLRQSFRPNIVLEGGGAFWEDRLYHNPDEVVVFKIGSVTFEGMRPCDWNILPARIPDIINFQKQFARNRKRALPRWTSQKQFEDYYRFMASARGAGEEGIIKKGDQLVIQGNRFCG